MPPAGRKKTPRQQNVGTIDGDKGAYKPRVNKRGKEYGSKKQKTQKATKKQEREMENKLRHIMYITIQDRDIHYTQTH